MAAECEATPSMASDQTALRQTNILDRLRDAGRKAGQAYAKASEKYHWGAMSDRQVGPEPQPPICPIPNRGAARNAWLAGFDEGCRG